MSAFDHFGFEFLALRFLNWTELNWLNLDFYFCYDKFLFFVFCYPWLIIAVPQKLSLLINVETLLVTCISNTEKCPTMYVWNANKCKLFKILILKTVLDSEPTVTTCPNLLNCRRIGTVFFFFFWKYQEKGSFFSWTRGIWFKWIYSLCNVDGKVRILLLSLR